MALDVGDVRIGVAMSDPLGIIASPHSTIAAASFDADARAVEALAREHEVACIVVGMPLNLKGEAAHQAEKVQAFIETLRGVTDIEITTVDERMTTASARRSLAEQNVRGKKLKGLVDQVAAQQILQLYLERRANLNRA